LNALSRWWVERDNPASVAQHMWDKYQDPHRLMLLMALQMLPPVERVYELGCGSGPNLRLIRETWPEPLTLGGSEPSPGLAVWASEHLGIHIDPLALPDIPSDSWDIVLTCYTLAYVEPPDVLSALTNIKARHLILAEPNGDAVGDIIGLAQVMVNGKPVGVPEWHHDYSGLLRESGWGLKWRWPLVPRVHGLNAVLIADRL
jgi:SAM-dependent methyltransferase